MGSRVAAHAPADASRPYASTADPQLLAASLSEEGFDWQTLARIDEQAWGMDPVDLSGGCG